MPGLSRLARLKNGRKRCGKHCVCLRELTLWSLAERRPLAEAEIEEAIRLDGVLRVHGLSADLDLFRKPNGLELADFDAVWQQATTWADAVRVMDPIDLILTKADTGRNQDAQDVMFLELKVRTAARRPARRGGAGGGGGDLRALCGPRRLRTRAGQSASRSAGASASAADGVGGKR